MAGTNNGGNAAANTNKLRYGEDFYKRIGAMGGKASNTGGFYVNRELARKMGAIGGAHGRKGYKKQVSRKEQLKRDALEVEQELQRIHVRANS